jgi:hypothetical protein
MLLASAVLRVAVIGAGIGVSAEAVAPGTVPRPAAAAVDGAASVASGSVAFSNGDDTVRANRSTDSTSAAAQTYDTAVSLRGLDASDEGTTVFEHGAIDHAAAGSVAAGLCAAGLGGPDSRVAVAADGTNGSARVEFSDARRPTVDRAAAGDVVARCSDGESEAPNSTSAAPAVSTAPAAPAAPATGS